MQHGTDEFIHIDVENGDDKLFRKLFDEFVDVESDGEDDAARGGLYGTKYDAGVWTMWTEDDEMIGGG